MYQALYRKWRPQTFDDVYGQEHITSVLRYEAEHRQFSHAYLFCGSRGTGKTTCAKILARVANCAHPKNGNPCGECDACRMIESGAATDIIEMDAASNNGVDNIRDIRDEVVYSPSSLQYRVYIIDEVHMLSPSAFNALLKTLEEPPAHVIFILATTELQKLPATVISRCQRFDFRRISMNALTDRLAFIAKEEGIKTESEAVRMIAKLAQGGMRDAISLLELCAGTKREVTVSSVEEAVGVIDGSAVFSTVDAIVERDYDKIFATVDEVVRSSKDLSVFWQDLLNVCRNLMVVKTAKNGAAYLDLDDEEAKRLTALAAKFSKETLLYHCKLLEDAYFAMQKANAAKRTVAEMTLIRLCDDSLDASPEAMLSRISRLEDAVALGRIAPRATEPSPREDAPAPTEGAEQPASQRKIPDEVPKKPAPSPAPTAPDGKNGQKLRPIRNWAEVGERLTQTNGALAGFIKLSKGFLDEANRVVVAFPNPFLITMAEQDENRDSLRATLSQLFRREVGDRELIFEVLNEKIEASLIDELVDAIKDQSDSQE